MKLSIKLGEGDECLRILYLLILGGIILLMTAASDFSSLIQIKSPEIIIAWDSRADFLQLFELPNSLSQSYIIQKLGHIICFFMLALSVRTISIKTLTWLILFAFCTEILQLFTGRSGRLLDVGYDIVGILLGCFLQKVRKKRPSTIQMMPMIKHSNENIGI